MAPAPEQHRTILRTYYGGSMLMMAGFSLQVYLCIQGTYSFYRMSKLARRRRRLYMYIMVLTLLSSSLVFAADTLAKEGLLTTGGIIASDTPAPVWANLLYFFGIGVVHVLGDGLLAWRCYILWRAESRLLGLIPAAPYVSSIAMGITLLVAAVKLNPSLPGTLEFYRRILSAAYFLSIGVNICATALIILRLRRTDREIRAVENRPHEDASDTPYNRIAIMLVESALPFTLFGIAAATASTLLPTDNSLEVGTTSAMTLIWPLWINSCAIAPQLIIFRVATGASWITGPPQRTRSRAPSEPVFTTQLSNFIGRSDISPPTRDATKEPPSVVGVSQEIDLDQSDRGSTHHESTLKTS
ncbi:hypothetical protein BKA70DRAFT_357270 [Coprinopsis sp. MPI-PUGE-AT-0042]|nr:hypothetical protein BKA70DRAFT_357270 [Coprinopsis sp. MPI-PUGE-AT-0042]